ncbi:MAG: alpha-ketoacid dehydrogenase subunit beta, partial [Actinobacteria bacterium]|nr:alpha-ketoacid dehydrogenase subunit beta [Actinomycetota bacterium]
MSAMRFRQAIVAALTDEMAADESVIFFGEDVAAAEGPFKTSEGLLDTYGPIRVRDTPISEMGFTGAAVGAAMMGMRPVIEIMFMEFLGVALDALVTEGAKMHYLSKGEYSVPMVVRASCGSGLGFGSQHSQTLENWVAA